MSININCHNGKYFGTDNEGNVALLRIPGMDGEAEDIGVFKKLNESYCTWLPLCGDTFPTGSYTPESLFTNWADFPELHSAKLMAWDEAIGASSQVESQYVQSLINDFNNDFKVG